MRLYSRLYGLFGEAKKVVAAVVQAAAPALGMLTTLIAEAVTYGMSKINNHLTGAGMLYRLLYI